MSSAGPPEGNARHRRSLSDTWAVLYNNLSLEDAPEPVTGQALNAMTPMAALSFQEHLQPLASQELPVGVAPLSALGMVGHYAGAAAAAAGSEDAGQPTAALFPPGEQQQQADAAGGRPARARKPTDKATLGVLTGAGKRSHAASKGKDSVAVVAAAAAVAVGLERTSGESGSGGHQRRNSFTPALPSVQERDSAEDGTGMESPRVDAGDDEEDDDSDDYSGGGRGKKGGRRSGSNGRNRNELLMMDPKKVKRILANRMSAARSKERRVKYTMELEGKVKTLDDEVARLASDVEVQRARVAAAQRAQADADGRVLGLQQVVAHVSAANQLLMAELLELQRSLGLPEQLPVVAQAGGGAAASPTLQQAHAQQQQQQPSPQQQQSPQQQHKQRERLVQEHQLQQQPSPQQQQQMQQQGSLQLEQQGSMIIKQETLLGEEDGDVDMLAELLGVTGSPIRDDGVLGRSSSGQKPPTQPSQSQQQQQQQLHQQQQAWGTANGPISAANAGSQAAAGALGPTLGGLSPGPGMGQLRAPGLQQPPGPCQILVPTMSDPLADRSVFTDDGASTTPSWSGLCSTPSGPSARMSDSSSLPVCLQQPPQPLLLQQAVQAAGQQHQQLPPRKGSGGALQQPLMSQPLALNLAMGGPLQLPRSAHHQRSASTGSVPPLSGADPSLLFAPVGLAGAAAAVGPTAGQLPGGPGGPFAAVAVSPASAGITGLASVGYLVTTAGPGGAVGSAAGPVLPGAGVAPLAPFGGL